VASAVDMRSSSSAGASGAVGAAAPAEAASSRPSAKTQRWTEHGLKAKRTPLPEPALPPTL